MDDRKNLKIDHDTFERLSDAKRDGETWDGFFNRVVDTIESDQETDDHVPVCTGCGNRATEWTVEDGNLVCTLCAKGDLGKITQRDDL